MNTIKQEIAFKKIKFLINPNDYKVQAEWSYDYMGWRTVYTLVKKPRKKSKVSA